MDTLSTIFEDLGAFIKSFGGILLLGGVLFAAVKIVYDAKKPRIYKMQQDLQNPASQNGQTPPPSGQQQGQWQQPPPQGYYGQVPPYAGQQGYYGGGYNGQGPVYQGYAPPPQNTGYDAQRAKTRDRSLAKAALGLVAILFIMPAILLFVIMASCYAGVRGCDKERLKQYDEALGAVNLSEESDLPDSIELGSDRMTKLFASGYDIEHTAGECLVLANRVAQNAPYGRTKGYLVLTDKEGKLITEENEFYTHIGIGEKITYKGEEVIICTDNNSNGYFTPLSSKFEEQVFYSSKGKELDADDLSYNMEDFDRETYSHEWFVLGEDETYYDYTVETVGSAEIIRKDGTPPNAVAPQEAYDLQDEYRSKYTKIVKDQNGVILFPRNTGSETSTVDIDGQFSVEVTTVTGDIYKDIYGYNTKYGCAAAVRIDEQSGSLTFGLFDSEGRALYTSPLSGMQVMNSKNVHLDNFYDPLAVQIGDSFAFKTDEGYDIVSCSESVIRSVSGEYADALSDTLFITYSDNNTDTTVYSITAPDEKFKISDSGEAAKVYKYFGTDDIIGVEKDNIYTFYSIS